MTKQCKQVLKILNTLSQTHSVIWISLDHSIIFAHRKQISIPEFKYETVGILRQLLNDKYIEYIHADQANQFPYGEFSVTHKGVHWKQYRNQNIVKYLLNSILVPIIVALLTTIITMTLSNLIH